MNIFKRGMVFVTFFGCCFAMSLMAASLGTQFWFQADAVQKDSTTNFTRIRPEASGTIHFGLFKGQKNLNWGIGERLNKFDVDGKMVSEVMSYELWVATISLLCGALLFAVVGSIFAVINTATTPIEVITGVPGLYIWNGCAAVLGLACVTCWGVQYTLYLTSNVLVEDSVQGWTTKGKQHLGYSYWLVVVAVVIHIANCILIAIGTYERKEKTQYEAPDTKPGNIMLY
ncbi:UNVERIFIED_CONTAM: hypothetical protein RMT77_014492 [Armadillidium vulgare]